ncbi:MAG: hypothetical protein AAB919_04095, partial [Patescibacteria group bacterium]
ERHVDAVLAASRATYGMPRAQVEKLIDEWQKSDPAPELTKPKFEFRPDGSRIPPRAVSKPPAKVTTPVVQAPLPTPTPVIPAAPAPKPPAPVSEEKLRPRAPLRPQKPRVEVINKEEPKQPERPPLEGPKSLKEALAQVTGKKEAPPVSPLKEALQRAGPKNELSSETIRQMLDVEEPHGEK